MRGLSYDSMFREEPKRVILMHLQLQRQLLIQQAKITNLISKSAQIFEILSSINILQIECLLATGRN